MPEQGTTTYRLDSVERNVERHERILKGNGDPGLEAIATRADIRAEKNHADIVEIFRRLNKIEVRLAVVVAVAALVGSFARDIIVRIIS